MANNEDKIIKHLSLYYRIPVVDIKDIIKSQFKLVKEVITFAEKDKEETFKTIQLPNFGKFTLKKIMLKHIVNYKLKKERDAIKNRESNME